MMILILQIVWLIECQIVNGNAAPADQATLFLPGAHLQLLIGAIILTRVPFYAKLMIISGLVIYAQLRITSSVDNIKSATWLTAIFYLILVNFFLGHERFRAKKNKSKGTLQKKFEFLVNELIPSGIIIIRDQHVIFYNKNCERLLGVQEAKDIEERLQELNLLPKKGLAQCLSVSEALETGTPASRRKTDKPPVSKEIASSGKEKSLFLKNLASTYNEKKISINLLQFETFYNVDVALGIKGAEGKVPGTDPFRTKALEFKVGDIIWEEKPSKLVIINDNELIENLKEAKQEIIYKDRMLATVSHDLRSPLNGIIGALQLASQQIDGFEERQMCVILFYFALNLY